jgi:hypothetical protein
MSFDSDAPPTAQTRGPPSPPSRGGMKGRLNPMHKRDQVSRMRPRDWLALAKDKRKDLARRAQCDLLGSFRHCTDKRCRRARWCAGGDPWSCKDRLWQLRLKLKKAAPKTLRYAIAKLEDITYWRT